MLILPSSKQTWFLTPVSTIPSSPARPSSPKPRLSTKATGFKTSPSNVSSPTTKWSSAILVPLTTWLVRFCTVEMLSLEMLTKLSLPSRCAGQFNSSTGVQPDSNWESTTRRYNTFRNLAYCRLLFLITGIKPRLTDPSQCCIFYLRLC